MHLTNNNNKIGKEQKAKNDVSAGGGISIRVNSDQPTALIAPSDYEHIYREADNENIEKAKARSGEVVRKTKKSIKEERGKKVSTTKSSSLRRQNHRMKKKKSNTSQKQRIKSNNRNKEAPPAAAPITRVPSDQPTALIAPSDYEHIFKGFNDDEDSKHAQTQPQPNNKGKVCDQSNADNTNSTTTTTTSSAALCAKRIPSNTPTALIAPSDFEHIYRDPSFEKNIENPPPPPPPPSPLRAQEIGDRSIKADQTKSSTGSKATRKVPSRMKPNNSLSKSSSFKLRHRRGGGEGEGRTVSSSKKSRPNLNRKTKSGELMSSNKHRSPPPLNCVLANVPQQRQKRSVSRNNSDARRSRSAAFTEAAAREVLPQSIQLVVKRFIVKQSKTYTIKDGNNNSSERDHRNQKH